MLRSLYNLIPESWVKQALYNKLYQFSYLYALEKITAHAALAGDGLFCIELTDGTVFYGRRDDFWHSPILPKLPHLKVLQGCETTLGLICYQYVAGEYERYYKIRQGDVVVDAEANIGTFTVKAAQSVGKAGLVVAIEPESTNFRLLQRNVRENCLSNVICLNQALWSEPKRLELEVATHQAGHSIAGGGGWHTHHTGESQSVDADTLDNILASQNIGSADFLKVDIEGSEAVAMNGMSKALSGDVGLVIEISHRFQGQDTVRVVAPFLRDRGFTLKERGGLIYGWRR